MLAYTSLQPNGKKRLNNSHLSLSCLCFGQLIDVKIFCYAKALFWCGYLVFTSYKRRFARDVDKFRWAVHVESK